MNGQICRETKFTNFGENLDYDMSWELLMLANWISHKKVLLTNVVEKLQRYRKRNVSRKRYLVCKMRIDHMTWHR